MGDEDEGNNVIHGPWRDRGAERRRRVAAIISRIVALIFELAGMAGG